MRIEVSKFGKILNGRPAGREAALVLKQMFRDIEKGEEVTLDFADVLVLTPSYADEFLRGLESYAVRIENASPVVKDTLSAIDFAC